MSDNRKLGLEGNTFEPDRIIFREKSVRKLSFCIRQETFFYKADDMNSCSTDVVKEALDFEEEEGYYTVVETTINRDTTYSFIDGYNDNNNNLKFCLWRQDDNSVKIIRWLECNGDDDNLWIFKYMRLVDDDEPTLYYEDLNEAQQKIVENIISWEQVFDGLKNKSNIFSKKCYVNLNNDEDK
jgi:hypothetical protein